MSVKLSTLKAGDVIVGANDSCLPQGEYTVHCRGFHWKGNLYVICQDGRHYLDGMVDYEDHDTIHNFTLKDTQTMNDLIPVTEPQAPVGSEISEENVTMLRDSLSNFGQAFANMLVDASKLKKEFEALKEEVRQLREETARANHLREIADQAYNQVNAQRIEAENQLSAARADRNQAEKERDEALSQVATLSTQLTEAGEKVKALEADNTKLIREADETIASAKATAEAKVRDIQEKHDEKSLELSRVIMRLAEVERDNRNLRNMVKDAKAVLDAQIATMATAAE